MALRTDHQHCGLSDAKVKIGAALYDILKVKKITIDIDGWQAKAEGDNMGCSIASGADGFGKVVFEQAIMSRDIITRLMGETIGTAGTTPNIVETISFKGGTRYPDFQLEGMTTFLQDGSSGTIPADMHMKVFHLKLDKPPQLVMEIAKSGFGSYSFTCLCVADDTTGKIVDVVANETTAVIS